VKPGGVTGGIWKSNTISSQATTAPISIKDNAKSKKNEIFVDVLEKIFVIFLSSLSLIP